MDHLEKSVELMGLADVSIGPQRIALMDNWWRIIQAQTNDGDRAQGRVALARGDEAEPRLARRLDRGPNERRARAWGWRSARRLSSGTVGGGGWSRRAAKARHSV